jgi:hypothetical protein
LELDEGFFSAEIPEENKTDKIKRGRGSQKKAKVLVMAESVKNEKHKPTEKSRKVKHIKMKVIPNLKAETITNQVRENVSKEAKIDSDDSTSYVKLTEVVSEHHPQVINKKEVGVIPPWVHVAISNAKRFIINTFHDIKPEYLQSYLYEFCYKFIRRYFGEDCFERLMIACVKTNPNFKTLNG